MSTVSNQLVNLSPEEKRALLVTEAAQAAQALTPAAGADRDEGEL